MTVPCSHCKRTNIKTYFRPAGQDFFCQRCEKELYPAQKCTKCPRITQAPLGPPPICWHCRKRAAWPSHCVRCKEVLVMGRRRLLSEGVGCCLKCYPKLADPKPCDYCDKLSHRLARDYALGFNEPACSRCRSERADLPCCAGCRRPRRIAGTREDGKSYCSQCLPTGARPLIMCTACHEIRPGYSKTLCDECGWSHRFDLLMARLDSKLHTEWGKSMFAMYHRETRDMVSHGSWHRALGKDIAFFIELEKHFQNSTELSGVLIIRRMGWPLVRSHQRVIAFLAHAQLIEIDDPDYAFEKGISAIRNIINGESGWVNDLLHRYFDHLIARRNAVTDRRKRRRIPTKLNSMRSILASSRSFLEHARDVQGVESVQGLTPLVLDTYLGQVKGGLSLRSFIPYLNRHEKLFRRLKAPPNRGFDFPFHLILSDQERNRALRHLLAAEKTSELRWALIGLLSLLYGQHAHQMCAMKLVQVRATPEGHEVKLGKHWILLDPQTNRLMERWLSSRREYSNFEQTDESIFLFPGKQATKHVTPESLGTTLPFKTRMLRATGIASLVKSGISQPRVLIDGFGISRESALKYCENLSGHLGARARIVVGKYE